MIPILRSHRVFFGAAWCALTAALFAWPGFECGGFVFGHVTGYWPFLIAERFGYVSFADGLLWMMLALSGAQLVLCAWLMDRVALPIGFGKVTVAMVAATVLATFVLGCSGFYEWRVHSIYSLIVGDNHVVTRMDYYRAALIPRALAHGLWALHALAVGGGVWSVVKWVAKKTHGRMRASRSNRQRVSVVRMRSIGRRRAIRFGKSWIGSSSLVARLRRR